MVSYDSDFFLSWGCSLTVLLQTVAHLTDTVCFFMSSSSRPLWYCKIPGVAEQDGSILVALSGWLIWILLVEKAALKNPPSQPPFVEVSKERTALLTCTMLDICLLSRNPKQLRDKSSWSSLKRPGETKERCCNFSGHNITFTLLFLNDFHQNV